MVANNEKINIFLSQYDDRVFNNAMKLREVLFLSLPCIIEQIDIHARMIAYCYEQKYSEMICTIIPSKKGFKLGFNRGNELSDPNRLLKGAGKISRYVEIKSDKEIKSSALKKLLTSALTIYKQRIITIKD